MKRRSLIKGLAAALPAALLSKGVAAETIYSILADGESVARGPFNPTWESLKQYKVPEWYQNAKFGIWAHWGYISVGVLHSHISHHHQLPTTGH